MAGVRHPIWGTKAKWTRSAQFFALAVSPDSLQQPSPVLLTKNTHDMSSRRAQSTLTKVCVLTTGIGGLLPLRSDLFLELVSLATGGSNALCELLLVGCHIVNEKREIEERWRRDAILGETESAVGRFCDSRFFFFRKTSLQLRSLINGGAESVTERLRGCLMNERRAEGKGARR